MARRESFLPPRSGSLLPAPRSLPRAGLTLIELLVVIIILTTIVAAAIPILAPADSDRAVREATRGFNTFITGAQTRSTALRRPFGIALKRLSQDTKRDEDNGVCLEVFYVEQQPPYAGFDPSSRVCVGLHPTQVGLVLVQFVAPGSPTGPGLPPGWVADLFPPGTIRPGDVIEINGTRYELLSPASMARRDDQYSRIGVDQKSGYYFSIGGVARIPALPINDSGQLIQPEYDDLGRPLRDAPTSPPLRRPFWTAPLPYKILRQPTPTSDPPFQLPEGTAIDLRASGFGVGRFFQYPVAGDINSVDNDKPVMIMFTPEGRVEKVLFSELPYQFTSPRPGESETFDEAVVDNVYLLVGKRENIPAPDIGVDPTLNSSDWSKATTERERQELKEPINWLSGESRWVVIGPQSGRVVSIENAFVDPKAIIDEFTASPSGLSERSEPLRNQQILAAREFTYDMANMGGR